MRPIKLTIQAFGPFANRVEMDFRTIDAAPLFGIYGPTGGGKTSILDAITYALFGQSSGGDRAAEHLRSHFADPAVDTFVELIFKIGDKRFLIRRAPTQELTKKRGQGLTQRMHEAYLFEVTDLPLDRIAYPGNPGKLVAEKKVREVDERIEGLLGYTASQFRQVVVLPQGRFRELLTAQSRDRSEILRKLFDTSVYTRLSMRLRERRSAIGRDLERAKEAMKTILEGVHAETMDALNATIEDKDRMIAIAVTQVQQREVDALKAEAALEQGKRLHLCFKELDDAIKVVDDMVARAAEFEDKAAVLKSAETALRVSPAAKNAATATQSAREAVADCEARKRDADESAIRFETASRAFAVSEAREPERAALRRDLDDLERFRATWNDLEATRQGVGDATRGRTAAAVTLVAAERAAKDGEDELKQAIHNETNISKAKERRAILERETERLDVGCRRLEELETATAGLAAAERAVETASRERETAWDAVGVAREHRDAAERAFVSSTAAQLAHTLTPGEACPVCGSEDHPSPAATEVGTTTREEMEAARKAFVEAESAFNARRDRLSELTGDLKGQRIRVAERASAAPTDLVLADAREDLARQLDELKTVLSLVNTEDAVRARRIDAEAALDTAKSAFGTAQKASSEAENRLTALKAELEARLKDVPAELRGEQALVAATGKSAKRLKDALAFHDAAGVARQEAARDRDTKAALAKASEALVEKAIARVAEEDLLLKRALDQYGFDDEDAFKAARREEREMDTLRADIETFHKDKAAAEDRLKRATGEVDGKDRPDVTALDKTHADAKASVGEARDLKSKLQSDQAYLLDARRRYTEKTEEFECLDQVYREAALLGDVADGRGANVKRTPLVEYVLQTYFDDVLRHANARFRRMSRERFVLRRKQVASGGRGTAGLDITVFDTFTDQERDAATLSGGESFLAALSLALGLSDVVQAEAGGIRLDAIFIDEGFGHLDEEALDKALETLVDLGGGARSVGIISHVEEVKRMVPVGFDVVRAARGSEIRVRPGG